MKQTIIAIGKLRSNEAAWCAEYVKRLKNEVAVKEFAVSKSLPPKDAQHAEAALLLGAIPAKAFAVLLDERGKDLSSRELAGTIVSWHALGHAELVFIIGGADGVTDKVRQRADFTLSFGHATWPHRLIRVMLLEQIYRAQQIQIGHPYHRD
jgi:23S rRNA (pseudouridine1915-N3)-methyltransferase